MNKTLDTASVQELEAALEARKKAAEVWPKTVEMHLHSTKDDNYGKGKQLGLSDNAIDTFAYCCYEVALTLEVHQDGSAVITHVGGVPLTTKVQAT